MMSRARPLLLLVSVLATASPLVGARAAGAELRLPAGFTAHAYVTGEGFDPGSGRAARGIPSASTLVFDERGVLYIARTGRRYTGAEIEDLWPVFRIPLGGAQLTPASEGRFFYGPPLWNPQAAAVRPGGEVLVTTFDRERRIGVLYRLVDGRTDLLAGGTPPAGTPPLLRQPEGVAIDRAGNLYVADRDQGAVVKLDARGRVLDPRYVTVMRPRLLVVDDRDHLWVASDGSAEAPWQRGPGEIWRVSPQGAATLVLRGPVAAGMGLGPAGQLFVADRHAAKILVVGPEGKASEFATFTEGDAPRSLGFAPVTPATRAAGIAGDLFVVAITRGAWPVNDVLRISGPFEELLRR